MSTTNAFDLPRLLTVTKYPSPEGTLGVVECSEQLPFSVKRVYFHTEVPAGARRGAHGHINLQQFIVALRGAIEVEVIDRHGTRTFSLSESGPGLLLPKCVWRTLTFRTPDAVSLVLASEPYDSADYATLERLQSLWAGE